MIPTLPRFGLRKLSSSFKITVSIVLDYKDIIAPSIGFSAKLPSDVARIAIDGCKWIASRFHPVMFSERVQQHLTVMLNGKIVDFSQNLYICFEM